MHGLALSWLLLLLAIAPSVALAAASTPREMAALLGRWAAEAVDAKSVEDRQRGVRYAEEAVQLDPGNAELWLTLGRLHARGELDQKSRECFARAVTLAPEHPDPRLELGQAWKRQWVRTLDRAALDSAVAELEALTRLRPRGSTGWLRLAPLLAERAETARAADAAARATAGRPRRVEAALALAYLLYRQGDVERSDSLFRITIPRLDPTLQAWFRPSATAPVGAGEWRGLDPDPTTPENEVQLEYWSRVAHAVLLFQDPLRPELDARAETYVRYGPPAGMLLNPPGIPLYFKANVQPQRGQQSLAEYPLHAQMWQYPELGMRVILHDRSLTDRYTVAVARDFDPYSVPDPKILARRQDLVGVGDGLALVSTLPPVERRIDLQGIVARFEGARGPRLLAQIQAPGGPGDTLVARWAVLDAAGAVVRRASQSLALSACDPGAMRVGELGIDLPPGSFEAVVSVRDASGRRGLRRQRVALRAPAAGLALSDLVLTCGDPSLQRGRSTVHLEADVDGRLRGAGPLVAYFEIYRLAPGADGLTRFEYEYAVRALPDPDGPAGVVLATARREETDVAPMRRQFVTAPLRSLPPGRYRFEVRVRDLVVGGSAEAATEFVRE